MSDDKRPARQTIDVRSLTLVQLKKLTDKGSRRAKAELERRMRAMSAGAPADPPSASARSAAAPPLSAARPFESSSGFTPATDFAAMLAQPTRPADLPLPARAAPAASPAASPFAVPAAPPRPPAVPPVMPAAASAPPAGGAAAMNHPSDELAEKLRLLARQEDARQRSEDPPRLVGMALMAWGGMLFLGGLVVLLSSQHRGLGGYYLLGGALCAFVGRLLWQNNRLAIVVHATAAVFMFALSFMWRKDGMLSTFMQSAPVWAAACWLAAPAVRDPLD